MPSIGTGSRRVPRVTSKNMVGKELRNVLTKKHRLMA